MAPAADLFFRSLPIFHCFNGDVLRAGRAEPDAPAPPCTPRYRCRGPTARRAAREFLGSVFVASEALDSSCLSSR
jgi:hypothetical protein